MKTVLALEVILLATLVAGCRTIAPKQPTVVPLTTPTAFVVVSYPKKGEIPPQPNPSYELTKADITYLRWLIRFDMSIQRLKSTTAIPRGVCRTTCPALGYCRS